MEECFKHTDLEWRLAQIPDSACCRGVFLNMLDERAAEFGRATHLAYRDFFKTSQFSAFRLYPVKDYLTRLAKLAEIQFGPSNIYSGIFTIQAAAWPAWRKTIVGRTAFAVVGNNISAILRMMSSTFNKILNFSTFEVNQLDAALFSTRFHNQYVYIEHAMAGALSGVAEACGYQAELKVTLDDPFNGTIQMHLLPPKG
jgi:uncharacterized protein (TIGR02265 family)